MGIDTFDFTPDPISLLESNRNLGYSIEEAVSDLIDNSISAGANNISYEIHPNNGQPYFLLKDDGKGMSNVDNELVNSFRLGSKNPLDEREPDDLGRFGFGMKTASLSQARILTVITKKKGYATLAFSLDLNFIADQGKWLLKKVDLNLFKDELDYLDNKNSGTIIRWDNWDRAPKSEDDLLSLNSKINDYLSVCFHRFIDKGISICCNDYPISSCSPIPFNEGAELFSNIRLAKNNKAQLTSYILQHPKEWKEDYENSMIFNSFRLFDGFERQQGIYIYRCDRLLTPKGGWFGLLKKGNAAKLARVVIDYPNDADELWSLDITKTNASIPYEFLKEIKKLIETTKKRSVKKIVRGNRNINRTLSHKHSNIWKISDNKEFNSYKYIVDFDHPIFRGLIEEKKIKDKDLKFLLKLISENLPIAKIIDNNDSDPSKHDRMLTQIKLSETEIEIAKILFQDKMTSETAAVAFSYLLNFEPYCYCEDQLKKELL